MTHVRKKIDHMLSVRLSKASHIMMERYEKIVPEFKSLSPSSAAKFQDGPG